MVQDAALCGLFLSSSIQILKVSPSLELFAVIKTTQTLLPVHVSNPSDVQCFVNKIWVVMVQRRPRMEKIPFYYGRIREFSWDLG
jgi:hypothetical protein